MSNPLAVFEVGCSGCPRRYSMNVQTMLGKKNCSFCGAPLIFSPEAKAACDAKRPTTVVAATKISGDCPVCARSVFIDSNAKRVACQYCSCPCGVDATGKIVALPKEEKIPPLSHTFVNGITCPSCWIKKLAESDDLGRRAKCKACNAETDLGAMPLHKLLDLRSTTASGFTDFVRLVLTQRWSIGDLGLPEAEELMALARDADQWTAAPGSFVSPFDMETTLEIVQFAILVLGAATTQRAGPAVRLVIETGARESGASTDNRLIAANIIGVGLLATTGFGFTVRGSSKEQEATVEPAVMFEFTPDAGGVVFSGLFSRDRTGRITNSGRTQYTNLNSALRNKFKDGMRRYYALKALYGIWLPGSALPALNAKAIEKRLTMLGGALAENAQTWSAAWVPEAMQLV